MGILIKNGHILNPPTGTDEVMDLYVEGDRVTKMQKDLEEIDPTVRAALQFIPVEQVDAVLAQALDLGGREEGLLRARPVENAAQGQNLPSFKQ